MKDLLRQGRHTLPLVLFTLLLAAPWALAQEPGAAAPAKAAAKPAKSAAREPAMTGGDPALLARQQGNCEAAALDFALANAGPLKNEIRAAGLRVAYSITAAEGWWDNGPGNKLAWHDAPAGSMHLRVFVASLAEGRLLSGLNVHARLTDTWGNQVSAPSDFGWYPLVNANGGNFTLDAESSYTLRVTIDADPPAGINEVTVYEFPAVEINRELLSSLPLATSVSFAKEAELLRPCSAALSSTITALWHQTDAGAEEAAGDYFIGYALGEAAAVAGRRENESRRATLRALHLGAIPELAIFPRDARTGRVIPGLNVQAELLSADNKPYGKTTLPFTHARWFAFYDHAVPAPRNTPFKMKVTFDAPGFRRWGRQGDRFAAPVEIEMHNLLLK